MKVLISGAGIGGFAAARALIADGHEVTVFEQATELRQGGAAVTLWSNGTGILAELGVRPEGVGAPIDVLETRDHRGKPLVSIDVAPAAARYGHPHVCLPRARLLDLLARDLPPGTIMFGRAATAATTATAATAEHGTAVRVTFTDGGTAYGDLLVAADGRGSAIRDQLWGGDPGRPTGWATWQGLSQVPIDITTSRSSVLFVGKPGSCGLMPAGDGLLQWWFDLKWTPGAPPPVKPVAMLRERFGDWAPPVRAVLAAVTDDETGFFPHCGHPVPRTWGSGRVTVIGDAAHSMPPTRAQGANQALEDAWALAAALRNAATNAERNATSAKPAHQPDTGAALRAFERSRSRKASVVSRQAGTEDYNRYGAVMSRLIPGPLARRYYTRWLRQISSYLDAA
ncbi:MAG TPA: FAD-dependent monooxygenase [Trebonia sp.]|nr:FAD-dependent monooxygenase [Trebonia sp.]